MQAFYSTAEVAKEFGTTDQTVRNWIEAGQLLAIQATPGGNYKIPAQALLVFKQNAGLLPKEEPRVPSVTSREFPSAEELYTELIAPRLSQAGASSVPELMARAENEPALASLARELLPAYDLYLKECAASEESRSPRQSPRRDILRQMTDHPEFVGPGQ